MSPEAAAFIVLGLCVLAGAGLLMLGGWLVGYDLSRKPGARTSRLMEDLRPVEDLMVDFFAHSGACVRLLNYLVANPQPLPRIAALRNTDPGTGRGDSGDGTLSTSQWVGLLMMRLAGLVRFSKQGVRVTDVGREVHRRIATPSDQ
jgi:hypothetical protein